MHLQLAAKHVAAAAPILRSESHWGDPAVVAGLAVAFGTIVLAILTYVMSRATRSAAQETSKEAAATVELASAAKSQLEAAERELELNREALDASVQPLLVNTPRSAGAEPLMVAFKNGEGHYRTTADRAPVLLNSDGFMQGTMTFTSIGRGAAVVLATSIFSAVPDTSWAGDFSATFVSPGDQVRIKFSVPRDRLELTQLLAGVEAGAATIRIAYSDVSGRQRFWSDAHLYIEKDPELCRVRQLAVSRMGESEPFAVSGPIDA